MNASPDPFAPNETASAEELVPGTTLLHRQYVIESFLSSGGFGITYLARDSLDRRVVVKECFPRALCRREGNAVVARSRVPQDDFRSMVHLFVQEARNLAKLRHPNIVGVHQVFEDNDTAYMALDYVAGRELLDLIEERTKLGPPGEIAALLGTLLDTVEYIHAQGVLHRDISPDNILVQEDGSPVLIDFGAARAGALISDRARTALLAVKDGYSPQEFYITGTPQGQSSDLYALAATFYHLLTGEAPPNSQDRLAAVAEKRPDPIEPVAGRVPGYDSRFLEAIDRALAVFPKDRFQSAAEWKAHLKAPREPSADVSLSLALARRREALANAAEGRRSKPRPAAASGKAPHLKVVTSEPAAILPDAAGEDAAEVNSDAAFEPLELREEQRLPQDAAAPEPPAAVAATGTAVSRADPADGRRSRGAALAAAGAAVVGAIAIGVYLLSGAPATETDVPPAGVTSELAAPPEAVGGPAGSEAIEAPAVTAALRPDPASPGALATLDPDAPPAATAPASSGSGIAVTESAPEAPSDAPTATFAEPGGAFETAMPALRDAAPERVLPVIRPPAADEAPTAAAPVPVPQGAASEPEPDAARDAVRDAAPVMAGWVVDLPFETAEDATTITSVRAEGPAGLAPGQRIVSVEGAPVTTLGDIRREVAASGGPGLDGTWRVSLGIMEPGAAAAATSLVVPVPATRQIVLLNGLHFEAKTADGTWITTVTESPYTAEDAPRAGDVVVAYLPTGETVEGPDSLASILTREIDAGVTGFNFAVRRDLDLWAVSMDYAPGIRD